MKKQNLRQIGLYMMLATGLSASAQNATSALSLEDAIQAAQQYNKQVVIAKADAAIAQSNYKQTEAVWLPQLNLSHTAYSTNNPLNVFGFKLQQASVQQQDFNPATLNNPSNYSNYNTQIALIYCSLQSQNGVLWKIF